MDITVRLYRLHDYDLIYLLKNLQYPVRDVMKKALIAYVRNTPVFFDFPIANPLQDNVKKIKNAQFHLKLDEDSEADIIEFLSELKPYYRNSFLKNLTRYYIAGVPVFSYEQDPDIIETEYKNALIKNNIENIEKIELLKKKKKQKKEKEYEDRNSN